MIHMTLFHCQINLHILSHMLCYIAICLLTQFDLYSLKFVYYLCNILRMSEIILNWLNDQIQLSKRINNFEDDFNNGYLFGEILAKYNQQLNFSQFCNKDDKKSKIKNFQLLFDTLTSLGVTFNSMVANEIINKKNGVAKKLLYELKMHLQKTNSNNTFTKTGKMAKTLSPLKKLKVSKQQYDKVDKQHFVKQLNELHPAQKTLNQQKLLKRFSDFHQKQIQTNNKLNQKQQQSKVLSQKKFRQCERNNLKKTADFRNQWQRSNVEKWQVNMTVRNMQNEKDNMFKTKLQHTQIQNKTMSQLNAIKALDRDINAFERKFIKNKSKVSPIQDSSEQDEADEYGQNNKHPQVELTKKSSKLSSKIKFGATQNGVHSLESSLKKRKMGPQITEQQKHQRQKKRRKMIVQQNKRYQLIEISRRQKYILSTIQQTSKQQKQLEYEIWRVWQNKQIIKENKKLQEQKENEKTEIREINAKFKREELLKTYRQQHQMEVKESVVRERKLLNDHKVVERKKVYSQCQNIVNQFIQISEQCFLHQQQKNSYELNENLINHLFSEFVEEVQTQSQSSQLELSNYINGKDQWNVTIKKSTEGQPVQPTQENALPQKAINNYALGNILRLLYQNKFKESQKSSQNDINGNINSDFILCLLGLEFAGKHLIAQKLRKQQNFNVVQIQKLIENKIQQFEAIKGQVSEVSVDTLTLVQLAYGGKDIPSDLLVRVITDEIRNNPKTILLNFPTNCSQALQLTKSLRGVEPSDFKSKSEFQQRVNSFSRLVWPTESKVIERPLKQCGVDLALWIDISSETSYDRYLGRRWIEDNVYHINDQIANNVNQIRTGEKASVQIFRNYQKIIQLEKIKAFFEQFGTQITKKSEGKQVQPQEQEKQQFKEQGSDDLRPASSSPKLGNDNELTQSHQKKGQINQESKEKQKVQNLIKRTWQKINGQVSIQQIQNKVLKVVQQAIKVKQLKKQIETEDKENKQKQLEKLQEIKQFEEELKKKCVLSSQEEIQKKFNSALNAVQLGNEFVVQICNLWQKIQNSTIQPMTKVFRALHSQGKYQQEYFASVKRNLINLLTRPDKKFSAVKEFQINYNQFYDENKEMISQDYTKEELHQRVDDLEDVLFEIIQLKKDDAVEERKTSMESGWLESQFQQFYNCVRILLQAQLNRFNVSEKIILDFYSKKYAVPQSVYEVTNTQINYDSSLEMFNKQGSFPRLQKLISETMRIFNKQEEVVDDKNKKGGKGAPLKKDDKKGGKKGEIQEIKQPTKQQIEMKKCINIEKSILRYRVSMINEYGLKKLSLMIKENESLYRTLEQFYQYTYEIETKCVYNVSKIFRENIENERKIQNEVEVSYVDVTQNEIIRNFQKQKPIILPAKQHLTQNRFSISNLISLIDFIKSQSESSGKITTKRLTSLLKYLQQNLNEESLLPQNWRKLNEIQLQGFITKLDSGSIGLIQLWKIFIAFAVTNWQIPSQKTIEQYFNNLTAFGTEVEVPKQKFITTKAWFDEEYEQFQNLRTFNRNEHIKEIIFKVLKVEDEQSVQGQRVIKSLSVEWYTPRSQNPNKSTYFSLFFE